MIRASYRDRGLGLVKGTFKGYPGAQVWTAHSATAADSEGIPLLSIAGVDCAVVEARCQSSRVWGV